MQLIYKILISGVIFSQLTGCVPKRSDEMEMAPEDNQPGVQVESDDDALKRENFPEILKQPAMLTLPLGEGSGLIAIEQNYKPMSESLGLTESNSLKEEFNQFMSKNSEVIAGMTFAVIAGGASAYALKKTWPSIKKKYDFVRVFKGWTDDVNIKFRVFQDQHIKNIKKYHGDWGKSFTEIDIDNLSYIKSIDPVTHKPIRYTPTELALLKSQGKLPQSGRIYLGIQPSDAVLEATSKARQLAENKRAKLEGRPPRTIQDDNLAILSVQEKFEFESFKPGKKGLPETHTAYQTSVRGVEGYTRVSNRYGKSTVIEAADYRPVPHSDIVVGTKFLHEQLSGHRGVDIGKIYDVYTNCKSGKGRSATMVVAYLMQYRGMPLDEAVALVKLKRPEVSVHKSLFGEHYPNLKRFEQELQNPSNNHIQYQITAF